MGAKAKRLLALIESESYGRRHRSAIEARAVVLARKAGRSELYDYHLYQAYIEVFNSTEALRDTCNAKVDHLRPRCDEA